MSFPELSARRQVTQFYRGALEPRGSQHSNGPSETTGLPRCPVAGWRGACSPSLACFLHPCHLPQHSWPCTRSPHFPLVLPALRIFCPCIMKAP